MSYHIFPLSYPVFSPFLIPSALLFLILPYFMRSHAHIHRVSFSTSFSFFFFFALSDFLESHMFLLMRLRPANETQSLIQSCVSPFFLQTSLKIRAWKAGVFFSSLPPSFPRSPSLALPWQSKRGKQRVKTFARRFLWLVLFSGWFCACKRHRKTEREQRRIRPGFRFLPSMCASNHTLLSCTPCPVPVLYRDFLHVLESRNPTSHYFTTEALIKKYI